MAQWLNHEDIPQLTLFPSPAASNATCGFPALRFLNNFLLKLMGPIDWIIKHILFRNPGISRFFDKVVLCSIVSSQSRVVAFVCRDVV